MSVPYADAAHRAGLAIDGDAAIFVSLELVVEEELTLCGDTPECDCRASRTYGAWLPYVRIVLPML